METKKRIILPKKKEMRKRIKRKKTSKVVSSCCHAKVHCIPPSQRDVGGVYCTKCTKECNTTFF